MLVGQILGVYDLGIFIYMAVTIFEWKGLWLKVSVMF